MWLPKNQQQLRSRTKRGEKWKRGRKKVFHFARILLNETPAWDSYPVTTLWSPRPGAPSPSLQPGMRVGTIAPKEKPQGENWFTLVVYSRGRIGFRKGIVSCEPDRAISPSVRTWIYLPTPEHLRLPFVPGRQKFLASISKEAQAFPSRFGIF